VKATCPRETQKIEVAHISIAAKGRGGAYERLTG